MRINLKNIKLNLPIAIVLVAIILGGTFYAIQVNKQKSIERQQQADQLLKQDQFRIQQEQDKKEYIADRKQDCLAIYKTESDKWNNVRGWRYFEEGDECFIRYKDPSPKSDAKCDELYPLGGDNGLVWLSLNSLCKDGEFENGF
jgi:type II secretory pathway pseudopilin PulG